MKEDDYPYYYEENEMEWFDEACDFVERWFWRFIIGGSATVVLLLMFYR